LISQESPQIVGFQAQLIRPLSSSCVQPAQG
jgi:hypothetical protein